MTDSSLKTKKLMVISPHFKLFLREQIIQISHSFSETTVLIPQPYFPQLLLNNRLIEGNFPFLRNAIESHNTEQITVLKPKFLVAPLKVLQTRAPMLMARSAISLLKKNPHMFDIIHAHRLDFAFTGAMLKDKRNIRLIITCHGSDVYDLPFRDQISSDVVKFVLEKADHVIAVCASDAKILHSSLDVSNKKLSIIPNGFNDELFKLVSKAFARQKLGLPASKRIILTIGTLHEVKGHTYLIDAINHLSKEVDVIVILIGTGPLDKVLREKIVNLGLQEKFLMVGWVPHNQISNWISACDVFVLPSLNEGLPTVIPEVFACGRPVIGTKVGGIPELISSNCGLIINPMDPESLSNAILVSLEKEWLEEEILKESAQYSLKNISKRIIDVYKEFR